MNPAILMHFKNGGGAVNYYVATAGLSKLQAGSKPTAWLVLDGGVPAAELAKLRAIAPVLTSLSAAKNFANAPLAYSNGLTGIGFYDQRNRLIVTATNQGAGSVSGNITLKTLPAGKYTATDLIAGGAINFTVGANGGALPISVARWDTRAFSIIKN
jgi:hypothetical protein